MRLLKFIPIKLTFFLVLGILVGYYFSVGINVAIAITSISILVLGILFSKQQHTDSVYYGITTVLTTIGIGILAISLSQPKNWSDHYSNQDLRDVHSWHIKILKVLKPTTFSDRYVGIIKSRNSKKVSGKVILNLITDATQQKHVVDDELMVYAKLEDIRPPLNPYQFNYKDLEVSR